MVYAVRGAVCAKNTRESIFEESHRLVSAVLAANEIVETEIISIIFTATPDLTAASPAAAIRQNGKFSHTPLLCMQEMAVDGMLGGCVRLLIHFNKSNPEFVPVPCYLGAARILRSDLE